MGGPEAKPEGKEPVTFFLKALGTCQSPPSPPRLPLSQGSGALSAHPTAHTASPREVQWGRHSTEGEGPGRHRATSQ